MKFDPKADPVLESGVKSFEINYFCTFRFINLLFMALMNLWNLNDVEMCMARVIVNVIFTVTVCLFCQCSFTAYVTMYW